MVAMKPSKGTFPHVVTTPREVSGSYHHQCAEQRPRTLWSTCGPLRTQADPGGPSRSLRSICKDMNFVIRFGRIGWGGGNHGCEGHFGKEVCCAAERGGTGANRSDDNTRPKRRDAGPAGR